MKQTTVTTEEFLPVFGLRNTHAQSVINSSGYRRRIVTKRSRAMLDAEQDWTLDGGDGVVQRGLFGIEESRRISGRGGDVGDTSPHGSCAEYGYSSNRHFSRSPGA